MIVATSVTYANSFSHLIDQSSGKSFPGLEFRVFVPGGGEASVDIKAYLDTGAEFCVYDGALIAPTLGIDLMAGREVRLSSAAGFPIMARIHRLGLSHPDLGRFTLDAAISTVPIQRNLLGRDLFRHIQIGFREFHQTFFITPDH